MSLRAAWDIAWLEFVRRVRDRSLLIQGIAGPLGLALIIGLAFGGNDGNVPFTLRVLVADEDSSIVSKAFVDGLDAASAQDDGPPVTLVRVEDRAAAIDELERDWSPALVIPDGFGSGSDPTIEVLTSPGRGIAGDIVEAVADQAAAAFDATRLATAATGEVVTSPPPPGLMLRETSSGGDFDAISYFAPSMAMLFLFFTVGASARSLLVERRQGTLPRVRAAPVTDATILVGKSMAAIGVGAVGVGTVWAISSIGFGAEWGDPLLVGVVLGLLIVVIGGIGALIAGVVRTDAQADSLTAAAAFALALVGGNFVTPSAMPAALERISEFTPNGIALGALVASSAGNASLGDELGAIAALAAQAVVLGAAGTLLVARRVR